MNIKFSNFIFPNYKIAENYFTLNNNNNNKFT